MNRSFASALAIAAAVAGNAFADDITMDASSFAGTRSRDQVQAELLKPAARSAPLQSKSGKSSREVMNSTG